MPVINSMQNYKRIEELVETTSKDTDAKIEVINNEITTINSEISDINDNISGIDRELTIFNTVRYQDLGNLTQSTGTPNPEKTVDVVNEELVGSILIGDTTYPVYRAAFKATYRKAVSEQVPRYYTFNFPSTFKHSYILDTQYCLLARRDSNGNTYDLSHSGYQANNEKQSANLYWRFNDDLSENALALEYNQPYTLVTLTLFYTMLYVKEV